RRDPSHFGAFNRFSEVHRVKAVAIRSVDADHFPFTQMPQLLAGVIRLTVNFGFVSESSVHPLGESLARDREHRTRDGESLDFAHEGAEKILAHFFRIEMERFYRPPIVAITIGRRSNGPRSALSGGA